VFEGLDLKLRRSVPGREPKGGPELEEGGSVISETLETLREHPAGHGEIAALGLSACRTDIFGTFSDAWLFRGTAHRLFSESRCR
jgi:hypothetical protein